MNLLINIFIAQSLINKQFSVSILLHQFIVRGSRDGEGRVGLEVDSE